MLELRWVMLLVAALTGGIMLALPHLSPRDIFFGVRTGEEFATSHAGRAALRVYRILVAFATLAGIAVMFAAGHSVAGLAVGAAGAQVAALIAYIRNYRMLRPHALPTRPLAESDTGSKDDRMALWAALSAPPFALPVAAMLYLRSQWDRIPQTFPVHYDLDGRANRWVERSERAVYAPLWFGEGMLVLMLALGAAMVLGSRRSARQAGLAQIYVAVMYFLGALFAGIGVSPVLRIPPVVLVVGMGALAAIIVAAVRDQWRQPAEATPDEYWTLGGIYNNPNDPALFVQKRIGYGITVNFGNPWAWKVLIGFFGCVAALVGYLVWAQR